MIDFSIQNEGSIVLFYANTAAAKQHSEDWFADAQRFGSAYVVEHRYAKYVMADLIDQGFEVAMA